ncbi:MAG: hypothetical protein AAFX10_03970, partial [Pseudomonadota bacterium]
MKANKRTRRAGSLAMAALACVPLVAQAGPGTLAESPLFLTNAVEPNILFLLDDSGSMDWDLMTEENNGLMWLDDCRFEYAQPAADNTHDWVLPSEESLIAEGISAPYGGVWRARNADYNRLYYNPTVRYLPWAGENSTGGLYTNITPTAAPYDPYIPANGSVDLTAETDYESRYCPDGPDDLDVNNYYPARYYTWTDTDGDLQVDAEDAHTLVEIRPANAPFAGGAGRLDCFSPTACTYAEEIQNFANWYSYYRRRELVSKAAYGQVVADASNTRMGIVTLHNNESADTSIESMNADPATGTKKTLLDALYRMQSGGGTPLRTALDEAGKYLGCQSNDHFGTCPAAPAADGGECQQNFTVMMTDGFYSGGYSGGVGNTDGDNSTEWDSGSSGPYGDGESDTLADIAMKYYEEDLRPGVDNLVAPPPSGIDENTMQHVVTYSVAFGVNGDLSTMPPNTTDPFAWPSPDSNRAKIDDLRHAAWNGRGEFLSAQNSEQLINGLRGALTSIQGRTGSASSVAFNTGSLSTNSQLYLALFNSESWSGDILAYDLDPDTGNIGTLPVWSADSDLTTRDTNTKPRAILTYDGNDGIPLQWDELTAAQKADFR